MNNPFARFIKVQTEEAEKIRQSEEVVVQAMEDLLEEVEK